MNLQDLSKRRNVQQKPKTVTVNMLRTISSVFSLVNHPFSFNSKEIVERVVMDRVIKQIK